ncbi:MAG: hypothetical protein ABIJ09_03150 [Pseudomonadota bacterium]
MRRRRCLATALMLVSAALGGCGGCGDETLEDAGPGSDAAHADHVVQDLASIDHSGSDGSVVRDSAGPDLATADSTVLQDATGNDLLASDSATTPDSASSDLAVTDTAAMTDATAADAASAEDAAVEDAAALSPVSLVVTPADPFIAASHPQQLTATGTFGDSSSRDMTTEVSWSSSDDSLIAVSASGLATFVKVGGPVTLTATAPANQVSGSVTHLARKIVFVTSTSGSADLGSWSEAGSHTGVAAGDAICQARASAAGLDGTFRAWLSDDTNDAYCHVAGFAGKMSATCGEANLPTEGGPWLRTDGFPFVASLTDLVAGKLLVSLRLDEAANAFTWARSFTGTMSSGDLDATGSCSAWTSTTALSVKVGDITWTTTGWGATNGSCSDTNHLICFELGSGEPLPDFAQDGKKAFVTTVSGTGDLSSWGDAAGQTGVAAADAVCQAQAGEASLSGSFKAWLSTSSVDAIDRFTSDGPWVTLDGVLIASSKADLTDNWLFTSINRTTDGHYLSADSVRTGTGSDGVHTSDNCQDWTSASSGDSCSVGAANSTGSGWTSSYAGTCSAMQRLYCLED